MTGNAAQKGQRFFCAALKKCCQTIIPPSIPYYTGKSNLHCYKLFYEIRNGIIFLFQ